MAHRVVSHKESDARPLGELATDASLCCTREVKLRIERFQLIGTAVRNVDNKQMITGKRCMAGLYREGMLFACSAPRPSGTKIKSVDAFAAKVCRHVEWSRSKTMCRGGKSTWQVNKAEGVKMDTNLWGSSIGKHHRSRSIFKDYWTATTPNGVGKAQGWRRDAAFKTARK